MVVPPPYSNPPQQVEGDDWKQQLPNTTKTDLLNAANRISVLEKITDGEQE